MRIPGIFIGNAVGNSSSLYWNQTKINNDCLFYASHPTDLLSKVSATKLLNQVTGSSDWLTVTGNGLAARYRTPDTADYKTADSDYVFWKTDGTESTCDGNRLIGYDFPRILVKYLNVSPYTILAIAILKPGVTVTNGMRDAFDLSIWWDNTLSAHGNVKQNRGIGQTFWYGDESMALFARMTAAGETPTEALKALYAKTIKDYIIAGIWDYASLIYRFNVHGVASSKMNLKGTDYPLVFIDTPTFAAKVGIIGDRTSKYFKTGYIPNNDTNVSQNDIGIASLLYSMPAGTGAYFDGCYDGTQCLDKGYRAANVYDRVNSMDGFAPVVNDNAVGSNYIGRSSATDVKRITNGAKETGSANSLGKSTTEFYIGAANWNGSLDYLTGFGYRGYYIGKNMTDAMVTAWEAIDAYFNSHVAATF